MNFCPLKCKRSSLRSQCWMNFYRENSNFFDYRWFLPRRAPAWMRPAKRVFDEGHALPRRNSASSYLPSHASHIPQHRNQSKSKGTVVNHHKSGNVSNASRVESNLFSSSSIAKMLNNFDYSHQTSSSSSSRRPRWKQTRSTSATSMKTVNRRSSSGSGLSSTSSQGSGNHYGNGIMISNLEQMGRASVSSSSLTSFDDRFDHLYSYSSNLDLFEHQLFKAEKRRKSHGGLLDQNQDQDHFDLTTETKWLMDRTDQLKEKNDREWVIWTLGFEFEL